MYILGDRKVEARIVYEYHRVGLPVPDVALHHPHVSQYGRQMAQHRTDTHIGQFAIVAHEHAFLPPGTVVSSCCGLLHEVAAYATELCLWVALLQTFYQV